MGVVVAQGLRSLVCTAKQVAAAVQRLREQLQHMAGLVRLIIHQNAERFQGRYVSNNVLRLHTPHVDSVYKGMRAKPTK